MTYEEKLEENRREYNRWLEQQQYRRQDEQWRQKRLEGDRAEAARYLAQGDPYLSILRRSPAAANAYLEQMRQNQAYAPASAAAAPSAVDYENRAQAEADAGNYTGAVNDLTKAITLEPRNAVLHLERGSCHYMLQRYPEAERDFSAAIMLNPNDTAPYLLRGKCRVVLGDLDGAINDLSRAESLLPSESLANPTTAISIYNNAFAQMFLWRGLAHYIKGDFAVAMGDFTSGIGFHPAHPDLAGAYSMRARALQQLNLPEKAIEDLTAAIKLNPTAGDFRERARSFRAVNNYAAALSDMDKVIQLDPTPDDYTWRGWTYLNLGGCDDEAFLDFQTAIGLGDQTAFVYLGRAHAQRNKGNLTEAIEDYDTVIRLDPDDRSAYVYRNRGRLRFDLGEYETALADFDEDVRINPTEPLSYMERGECHLKLGNRKAAKQDFTTATGLYYKQNMPDKGKEAFTRALGS